MVRCSGPPPLCASPRTTSLANFSGLDAAGEWVLYLVDSDSGATNMLTEWTLEVAGAATPTLAWTDPADITYGTPLSDTQLNATATYNSTPVPGTFIYSQPSGTILNAGGGQTISVTFTPSDSTSFLPVTTNVAVNVLKAPLTIAADGTNKVYGAALPGFTASYSGFVNGDNKSKLMTPVTLTTTAVISSSVGNYTITASGTTGSNYDITFNSGTLSITPASLAISANNTNKVYGAALPGFAATYAGFVNGDTAANLTTPVTFGTSATTSSPVGGHPITASGATYSNYNITFNSGTLTVTPAALTVTANSTNKTYGAALPAFTATYGGFVNSDTTNNLTSLATVTTSAMAGSSVGSYPITASGAAGSNYVFSYVDGTLTIGQSLTTGSLTSSASPALPGASVTFTMTLGAVAPGAGTPTGSVNFRVDGSNAGSGTLSGGVATLSLNTLTHGSHSITAEYAGNPNFLGSTNTLSPSQIINTPPVAGNITIQRYATMSVKVPYSTVLTNVSDADSDTLNIAVASTSANGGTVTVNGGWIIYLPAAGFTNADSFTYTVTDGHGGSTTATVTVAIMVDSGVTSNLTITNLGNGSFRINGHGIPGRAYRLQFSDSPSPSNWQDLPGGSLTADGLGKFQFTDTTGAPTRFYRSATP